jgi:uncharacterized OB-fold protein
MIYSAPRNGREATPHWKAAHEGRLSLPFCEANGHFAWPPGRVCPTCGSNLAWRESSGDGKVVTFSIVRRAVQPEWKDKGAYVVAMIALDGGGRLISNIVDCDVDTVKIGARVGCAFVETTDPALGLPGFRLK